MIDLLETDLGRGSLLHLSHGERSDRISDPGEGLHSIDRPNPLAPPLSHPTRINPRWVGEGVRFRCGHTDLINLQPSACAISAWMASAAALGSAASITGR